MSNLLARIMLAIFMLPSAGMVMTIAYVTAYRLARGVYYPNNNRISWIVAAACTWLFVAVYWICLWRKSIRWTTWRRRATLLAAGAAAIVGGACGLLMRLIDEDFGFFVFACVTILAWLSATVFIWRESAGERAERLDATGSALSCPTCGYNLTGLNTARCPECGSTFTLDELVRRQPSREQAELQP